MPGREFCPGKRKAPSIRHSMPSSTSTERGLLLDLMSIQRLYLQSSLGPLKQRFFSLERQGPQCNRYKGYRHRGYHLKSLIDLIRAYKGLVYPDTIVEIRKDIISPRHCGP